jgi:hypothetical protein
MNDERVILQVGQQVSLSGHFDAPVMLGAARPLAKGYGCRVRLPDGTLDEAVIAEQEAAALVADSKTALVNEALTTGEEEERKQGQRQLI